MRKTTRIILHTVKIIVIVLLLAAFICLAALFAMRWVWQGARFTPESAMEAVAMGAGQRAKSKVGDYMFYYATGERDDWIYRVTPVVQNELKMYYAIPNPESATVLVAETGTFAGSLLTFEVNGSYHHFYIPPQYGFAAEEQPSFMKEGYDKVYINGNPVDIFKHSYFITNELFDEIIIGGMNLKINSEY